MADRLKHLAGWEVYRVGKEAVLHTYFPHFNKPSLQKLIKRAAKKGFPVEIPYSAESVRLLEKFKRESNPDKVPELKNFFLSGFNPRNRLFVFVSSSGEWQNIIIVNNLHTEAPNTGLMLRLKKHIAGSVEALIYFVFNTLRNEGFNSWSLNDVPFIIYDSPFLSKEYILNYIGRSIRFAYNYKGLYRFKNKFSPFWADSYIAVYPKLTLKLAFQVASAGNLTRLVIWKFFHRLPFVKK